MKKTHARVGQIIGQSDFIMQLCTHIIASHVNNKSDAYIIDHVSDFKPNALLLGFWGACIHSRVGAEFDQKSQSSSWAQLP